MKRVPVTDDRLTVGENVALLARQYLSPSKQWCASAVVETASEVPQIDYYWDCQWYLFSLSYRREVIQAVRLVVASAEIGSLKPLTN